MQEQSMTKKVSIFLFIGLVHLSGCNIFDSADNQILRQVYNRKESKNAILFLKEGNATLDNSLQIKLVDYDYELDSKDVGNVLTADSNFGETKLDSTTVTVNWQGNDTLVIKLNRNLRTYVKEHKVKGVAIIYEE